MRLNQILMLTKSNLTMSKIIGISGKMGSGKDTLAAIMQYHIAKHEVEKHGLSPTLMPSFSHFVSGASLPRYDGWESKRFADKLKECAALILGIPRHRFEDQDFKKENLPSEWDRSGLPMTYREFLQELGTEGARSIHPQFWVNALFSDFKENSKWILTDARFPNEADAIKERDGVMVQVIRTVDRPVGASHASETAMDGYQGYDYTIMNNGTLEDLSRQALSLLLQENIISNERIDTTPKAEKGSG